MDINVIFLNFKVMSIMITCRVSNIHILPVPPSFYFTLGISRNRTGNIYIYHFTFFYLSLFFFFLSLFFYIIFLVFPFFFSWYLFWKKFISFYSLHFIYLSFYIFVLSLFFYNFFFFFFICKMKLCYTMIIALLFFFTMLKIIL